MDTTVLNGAQHVVVREGHAAWACVRSELTAALWDLGCRSIPRT